MLQTGFPNTKDYLDTILSECITCNLQTQQRKWITQIHKFKLNDHIRKEYDNILKYNLSPEKMYNKLAKLIHDKVDYILYFEEIIKNISGKALIYAKSKKEAINISQRINSVTHYPNKSGKHVVISYTDGTYGLNDLIKYNTLITRPYYPDKIPQMKGRLDRIKQKSDILHLEYILLKDTIEEAWLIRLEMTNNFYKNHVMPLAEFYNLAINQ